MNPGVDRFPRKRGLPGFHWHDPAHRIMLLVIALAVAARLFAIFASFPHLHWADESYKFFEPAHRMAFGYGLVVWEFRDGISSPVLPAMFATLWTLIAPVFDDPRAYVYTAQILLALLSIPGVIAVVRMGLCTSPTHALIAGVAAATWYEIVYYAGRPLSEAVATTALIVALSLASMPQQRLTRSRLMGIGAGLGVVLMLRIQLAPALLVAACLIGQLNFRERWWPMALGGAIPVVLFAGADWLYWGNPLASTLTNVQVQLLQNKASTFGVMPADWYLTSVATMWGKSAWPVLLVLVALRARASFLWIAVALVILATHSLVPHKEYRFIFPALACLIVTAAMGSADLVEKGRGWLPPRWGQVLVVGVMAAWIAVSVARPRSSAIRPHWTQSTELLQATLELPAIASLCGVLFKDFHVSNGGGYAYIRRKVPIYGFGITPPPASTDPYNAVVLKRASIPQASLPDFRLRACFGSRGDEDVCVLERAGACKHDPSLRSTLEDPQI